MISYWKPEGIFSEREVRHFCPVSNSENVIVFVFQICILEKAREFNRKSWESVVLSKGQPEKMPHFVKVMKWPVDLFQAGSCVGRHVATCNKFLLIFKLFINSFSVWQCPHVFTHLRDSFHGDFTGNPQVCCDEHGRIGAKQGGGST